MSIPRSVLTTLGTIAACEFHTAINANTRRIITLGLSDIVALTTIQAQVPCLEPA